MANLFQKLRDVLSSDKSQPTYPRYTTADLQRDPKQKELVTDFLGQLGHRVENLARAGVTLLTEGNPSDQFRKDAERQPNDRNRDNQIGLAKFREFDDWLK